jgi:hypothetical protein
MPAKKIKLPEIYYDARTNGYWLKLENGVYLPMNERGCKVHFMRAGFRVDEEDACGLKSGDRVISTAQIDRYVDYAGPLAGHRTGLFVTDAGKRCLVTSTAQPVAPKRGTWKNLERFFNQLFADQQDFVLSWLKCALRSLNRGDFQPGQLLVLAGESNCGKSFFQFLVTLILGGRSASPYRYMTGETAFNSDLAAAEHLMIEDENASPDIRSRRAFGASIKNFTVVSNMSVHAKGREAITLPTFKRFTLSVNDEHENLMILPPMDASILDKVMLLKCGKAELFEDRKKNVETFAPELPALVNELLDWKIPRHAYDSRFGVKAYHHPELLEVLASISPEQRLEGMLNEILFEKEDEWRGSSMALEKFLRNSPVGFAADRLFYFAGACGVYLARLARKHPDRYETRKSKGTTEWLIKKETDA